MKATLTSLAVAIFSIPAGMAAASAVKDAFQPLKVETLPSLSVPRSCHVFRIIEGEPTVLGGHTTGFNLTDSGEWFDGKQWHSFRMAYPHDGGFSVLLEDGSLMVGGGCAEPFGIGQTWGVEIYNPLSHSCDPYGILDRKRAFASALNLGADTLAVSGNWYSKDGIEIHIPGKGFIPLKEASADRCTPYMLPSPDGDALIFSSWDSRGNTMPLVVDRLKGEPFMVPAMEQWNISSMQANASSYTYEIGRYDYLLTAKNVNDGRLGLIRVSDNQLRPIECDREIPMYTADSVMIIYNTLPVIDKRRRHAYLVGNDRNGYIYLADINYDSALVGSKAHLRMSRSEAPLRPFIESAMALDGNGNIMLTGGIDEDNFHPVSSVYLLMINPVKKERGLLFPLLALLAAATAAAAIILARKKKHIKEEDETPAPAKPQSGGDMLSKIIALMEEEQVFRRKDLRLSDLALMLGTNSTYISACINSQLGQSFNSFVTGYRIRYATHLMENNPDMVLTDVSEESGFTSERSFFRNFKTVTGLTPSEWKARQNK